VFSITLALFVVGVLGLLIIHSQKLAKLIKENIEVQVYLKKNISESQKIKVLKTLGQYDFVAKDETGSPRVAFISKETAAKNFIEETGDDFVTFLGENPLRDVYLINIDPEHQTEEELAEIAVTLAGISGVFEVEYVKNLVHAINKNVSKISIVLLGFAVILVLVVIILINNTIKLALFSQRFLIRSMQLVGATSGFIRKPFLIRSVLHGLIGGVIAAVLLYGLSEYAYSQVEDLDLLKDTNFMLLLFTVLLILGVVLGFFSTLRSINKYLKLTLDELY
jgi:cell division transport system permease protein